MANDKIVHLYVWSGDAQRARTLAAAHYSGIEIQEFPHRKMRGSTFAGRLRLLQGFRGRAIVFHFASLADLRYRQIIQCVHFLHHCDETVLCDSTGRWQALRASDIVCAAPGIFFSVLRDAGTLVFWWIYLRLRLPRASPVHYHASASHLDIAYLVPSPATMGAAGGAISHIRGFLNGLKASEKQCRVFTGAQLAQVAFDNEIIEKQMRTYFFWEAALLSWNFTFARGVQSRLGTITPRAFYQRHGRLSTAGALLSRRLNVPLILEYNGPEAWMADHWDPTPFRGLIALCEEFSLWSATTIVVVSEVLKADLLQRGFPASRIRVNPNAVDGAYFCPGPRRETERIALQVPPEDVLVGFVGSFSFWHGIEILEQAIVLLLSGGQPPRLRFLLVGDGLLRGEMRANLASYEQAGDVIFTGSLPPEQVIACLDAADILVAPHIPMPDGSRFFGSPTKLFEYMAMGKAIVASRLEQLAEVLTHDQTAWLVTPGNAKELAQAIWRLALDPAKRTALGAAARETALQHHSWKQNVATALQPGELELIDETRISAQVTRSISHPAGDAG